MTHTDEVVGWKENLRDWWYSVQDLLADKDVCLHERKRVEFEHIIQKALTTAQSAKVEEVRVSIKRELDELSDMFGRIGDKEVVHTIGRVRKRIAKVLPTPAEVTSHKK